MVALTEMSHLIARGGQLVVRCSDNLLLNMNETN